MTRRMVVESDLASLSDPLKFILFSDAYLDSASRLCAVLKRSPRKSNYARGAVVLYLMFHAIELFLKGAILERKPKGNLKSHDIQDLSNQYHNLYRGNKYKLHAPFISRDETDLSEFYSPETLEERKMFIQESERKNPQDQRHRYPRNQEGQPWEGLGGFEPESCLVVIKNLKADIARLTSHIFPPNTVLRGTRRKSAHRV
jgi:hypothetical protein